MVDMRTRALWMTALALLSRQTAFAQGEPSPEAGQSATPAQTPTTTSTPSQSDTPSGSENSSQTSTETKEKVSRKQRKTIDRSNQSGTGFGVFGGADLGILFTNPSSTLYSALESSQLGISPTFKIGGTVFTKRIVLDMGLGLNMAYYNGTRIGVPADDGEGGAAIAQVKDPYSNLQTTMLVEAAARIRFKQKFQAGLLGTGMFSLKSANFTSFPDGIETNPEKYTVFLGPQFIYETDFRNWISRIGASFSMSLTGSDRTAYIGTLHAGLGSYLIDNATVIRTESETKVRTKVTREVINMRAQKAEIQDNVSFIFDSQMVNFKLNSSELSEKSAAFIAALGQVFSQEKELWNKLIVEGHTDSRGSENYNKKLSSQRAKAVLDELSKAGVATESMEAVGLGSSRLLVSPERSEIDYARNRRVEIRLSDLKDARKLQREIDEVQLQFFGKAVAPKITKPAPSEDQQPQTEKPQKPAEPVWDPGLDSAPPADK